MVISTALGKDWFELGRLQKINRMIEAGILGPELCPEPDYWHWPVLKPAELPDDQSENFIGDHAAYGEVRLY